MPAGCTLIPAHDKRMKTTLGLIGAATVFAGNLFGGSQEIIKQRAKELVNENNVRQGVPPPVTPSAAPSTFAAPANPQQQQALARLKADLAAIKPNASVTAEQKQQLAKDIIAAAGGASKPSHTSATALAEDMSAALAGNLMPDTSRARLVQELDAVLNPTKYPQAKMEGIFSDIQAIFQTSGAARKDAVKISDSVKAIAAEVRK
jgi:hypothetical protein